MDEGRTEVGHGLRSGGPPAEHRHARRSPGARGDGGDPATEAVPVTELFDEPAGPAGPAGPEGPNGPNVEAGPDRPGPASRRPRILPRSVLGLTAVILAFSVGAAFSGAVLYSYYQYRLDQSDARVNHLVDGYRTEFSRAEGDLAAAAASARASIASSATAASHSGTDPAAQQALLKRLSRSLFFVTTSDANGANSVATAFVIASNDSTSLLLTSYSAVSAATVVPGPPVHVRPAAGGTGRTADLRSWDPTHDLALLVLDQGDLPALTPAPTSPAPQVGETVFAVAGLGTAGGTVTSGQIDDVSSTAIAEDAPLGPAFRGAPLVDEEGQVLAVASTSYSPLGFTSSGVWYAPPVRAACDEVLSCPGGSLNASS